MTDHYPNIKEEFEFGEKGERTTRFSTRYTDATGKMRKVGLIEKGEISDEKRKEIYAKIDDFIRDEKKVVEQHADVS